MNALILNIFNNIGSYGPFILFIISTSLLWDKNNLFNYYYIGIFMNTLLNIILKGIFQQPRPLEDVTKFNLALSRGKNMIFKNGIMSYNIFGMPSGHAQSALYSTMFMYFSLKNDKIIYIYLLICLLTIAQRVVYNYHTILQVTIGSICGIFIGYVFYLLASSHMKGHLTEKMDDNGPI
jgi:membrane-associated phospholipid phosphatase